MAIYPHARYRPVRNERTDPPIQPVGLIFHVAASLAPSLFGWFDGPSGGVESHWHVPLNGKWPTEQYRDSLREADANYRGNSWMANGQRLGFHSVETAGLLHGRWTDHQLDVLEDLARWDARTHGWPLRLARHPHDAGLGYHTQFGSGPLTLSWSNARGKQCPGPERIEQFRGTLLPRLTRPTPTVIDTKPPKPSPQEFSMDEPTRRALTAMLAAQAVTITGGRRQRDPETGRGIDSDPAHVSNADLLFALEDQTEALRAGLSALAAQMREHHAALVGAIGSLTTALVDLREARGSVPADPGGQQV